MFLTGGNGSWTKMMDTRLETRIKRWHTWQLPLLMWQRILSGISRSLKRFPLLCGGYWKIGYQQKPISIGVVSLMSQTLCASRGAAKRSPHHICSYIVRFLGLSGSTFVLGLAWLVLIQTTSGNIFSNLSIMQVIQRHVVLFYNYYGFCAFGWCGMNKTTDCSKTLKHLSSSY